VNLCDRNPDRQERPDRRIGYELFESEVQKKSRPDVRSKPNPWSDQFPESIDITKNDLRNSAMASAEKKRKVDFSLPDCVVKSLECPVCLETIKDPPIYLCEKGHGLCQTCRTPLKAQKKPCPVCRGKLTEARNLGLENILDQLPKIKCKNEGCTFERSDGQLVKRHEDEECSERPVSCELCLEPVPVAMSKLWGHLVTTHARKPLAENGNLGDEWCFLTHINVQPNIQPIGKVNNDLEFIFNWQSYDANSIMFWLTLCGSQEEAKQYEYTIKIKSSADLKAGRMKFLLTGTGDCLSCDLSHEDVKKKKKKSAATEVMLFPKDILRKAAEGHDEKQLQWNLMIQKK